MTYKMMVLLFLLALAGQSLANHEVQVTCKANLNKMNADRASALSVTKSFNLVLEKRSDKGPSVANQNAAITFADGHEVVFNLQLEIGQSGFLSSSDTTSILQGRLQRRHTGGNGKVVLGASAVSMPQKTDKRKSRILMEIINVKAVEAMVNAEESIKLEHDPILFRNYYKEAIYTGTLDEGVVKSVQLECLTL
jgi:hypothetical protein